jgi:histidinol-phosphate phosphatase family protein
MKFFTEVDNSWTLFLDRDGVINRRPTNDYVKSWGEFDFLPGVFESLKIFSQLFCRVIVVTNQQGIGKNVMTEEDLETVHKKMHKTIDENGGRVDQVFYCPDLANKRSNCRKPGLTMANRAKEQFPEINFTKSIMAGDTLTDLQFGKNAGMHTIFINTNNKSIDNLLFDAEYPNLISFAKSLIANDRLL